jgi:hypothetical protein
VVGVLEEDGHGDVDDLALAPVGDLHHRELGAGDVVVDDGLVVHERVEDDLLRNEVPGDQRVRLLDLELLHAGVGQRGLEAVQVVDAGVQAEVAWLDVHDLGAGTLGGRFVVLRGDLDLADGELLDAVHVELVLHLAHALLVEPEHEGVAGLEFPREVVDARALFHVAW